MARKIKKLEQEAKGLRLERLFADVTPLPGDDVVFALADTQGNRVLREDGNFEEFEVMPSFREACQQVGIEFEVVAVTSAYLNSPRQTYWLMVSAIYHGQPVQDIIPIGAV